jgi:hypothetical protein
MRIREAQKPTDPTDSDPNAERIRNTGFRSNETPEQMVPGALQYVMSTNLECMIAYFFKINILSSLQRNVQLEFRIRRYYRPVSKIT